MAYRLWVGGAPSWRTADDIAGWCFERFGFWPRSIQIKWKGRDATQGCAFLGDANIREASVTLNTLLQSPNFYGGRVSVRWSQDSMGPRPALVLGPLRRLTLRLLSGGPPALSAPLRALSFQPFQPLQPLWRQAFPPLLQPLRLQCPSSFSRWQSRQWAASASRSMGR